MLFCWMRLKACKAYLTLFKVMFRVSLNFQKIRMLNFKNSNSKCWTVQLFGTKKLKNLLRLLNNTQKLSLNTRINQKSLSEL